MNRYPDKIIILKPNDDGTPYQKCTWTQVYAGRCRCFLDRQAAFRINKIMDCTYQVVIPDRNMPEIGENFKVGIKMHTDKSNRNWTHVGFVKDFARYDRVCNLYFQMVKENLIYEDVPGAVINTEKRTLHMYEDRFFHIESVGLVESDIFMEDEMITLEFLKAWDAEEETAYHAEFFTKDGEGEWVDIYAQQLFTYYERKGSLNRVYVLVGECQTDEPYAIRIEVWTGVGPADKGELINEREITIMPKINEKESVEEDGETE